MSFHPQILHILAHPLAEVYNTKAKEIIRRRVVVVKEEMLEMGEELKHSTFEGRRGVILKDILMTKDTSSNALVNSGPR